jgi:hypothetical protein
MARYAGRPHWAKDFGYRGDVHFGRVYPHWQDFKALRAKLDPAGVFVNPWLARTLGLEGADSAGRALLAVVPPKVEEVKLAPDVLGVAGAAKPIFSVFALPSSPSAAKQGGGKGAAQMPLALPRLSPLTFSK